MNVRHMIHFFNLLFYINLFVGIATAQVRGPIELVSPGKMVPKRITAQPDKKREEDGGKEKIKSLELRGVDILDVLKIIAKQSSFNIVTGKNVRGRVTIYLKNIEVWDAFQLIIKANRLAYVREGNNILVMTDKDYQNMYGRPFNDLTDIEESDFNMPRLPMFRRF